MCHSMRSAWQADLVEREEVGMERALQAVLPLIYNTVLWLQHIGFPIPPVITNTMSIAIPTMSIAKPCSLLELNLECQIQCLL